MKINTLKINGFGNIENKQIELSNNINIVKGNNESGKSTLLKFITDMFYGISKNKRGKEFSDYERYKPWNSDEFSGKLKYTLDNGENFEIFRDFNKKNPKIYDALLEDISKKFNIDKTNGNEFFIEQTKMDENSFLSTVVSMQQEVKIDRNSQNTLIQKVANLAGTGDDNISYKKALEKLNKKQVEEIGTIRTQGRPINIVNQEKEKLEKQIDELVKIKDEQYEIEETKNKIQKEIQEEKLELEFVEKMVKIKESNKLEEEKLQINRKLNEDNIVKIRQLEIQKCNLEKEMQYTKNDNIQKTEEILKNTKEKIQNINKKNKKSNIILAIIIAILLVIFGINIFAFKSTFATYIVSILLVIFAVITIITNITSKKKIKNLYKYKNAENIEDTEEKIEKEEINKVNYQIELIKSDIKIKQNEIDKIYSQMQSNINNKENEVKQEYLQKLDKDTINYYINNENLKKELEQIKEQINNNKLKYHSLELDEKNIVPKLEKLASLEEQLEQINEKKEFLEKNNQSIELVRTILEKAYNEMKQNVTPKFTQNLSDNILNISNGRYSKVMINDEEGLIVEIQNGEYVPIEKLSVGTIDQLYLSLRFALVKELSQESMPIILDESFAYYDENRLENILKYLSSEFKDNQIIIFTCTNREKDILNKLDIQYNMVNM